MSLTDKYIQALEVVDGTTELTEAREKACDALAFSQSLWDVYAQQGMVPQESEVDFSILENLVDAIHGELAALCVFLSEDSFEQVPKMLRLIADAVSKSPSSTVPVVVVEGYRRAAARIEATRSSVKEARKLMLEALENASSPQNDSSTETTS